METKLSTQSHSRLNILTDEWVLVSPHRAKRPWQGQEEVISNETRPSHDASCYLCAGNVRANGKKNPDYESVFVFMNDFAALQKDSELFSLKNNLLVAKGEQGICKVICFSPDHSKSLAQMSVSNIKKVVNTWKKEFKELGGLENINYVQIFENKGEVMGCSNPHPHGQIWSQFSIPNEILKKDRTQKLYFKKNKRTLLETYIEQELAIQERIIFQNETFVVLVPFWAVWPFESMIVPRKAQENLSKMTDDEAQMFAQAISVITKAYDKLFNCSFPYSSGIHQSPTNGEENNHWHWHMSFYPPLLRSATVKKFMVGYEMFGSPQRDITAETAAKMISKLV